MKSDSQLSKYMNHMAPPPRPAPDRRGGPARSGSDRTEPPPPLPSPRPSDGGTAVRRGREEPGPRAALAGSRLAPPAGAEGQPPLPREANAGRWPGSGGNTEGKVRDAAGAGSTVQSGEGAAPVQRLGRQPPDPPRALPRQPGEVQDWGGPPDPPPATWARSLQVFYRTFSWPAGNRDGTVERLTCTRHCAKGRQYVRDGY